MPEDNNRSRRQNCNFDSLFPELCYPKNKEHWRDLTTCVAVRDPCAIGIEGLFPPAGRRPTPELPPEAVEVGNDMLTLDCDQLPSYFGEGEVVVPANTFRRWVSNPKDTVTIETTKTFLNNLAKAFGLSQLECFVGNEKQTVVCPNPDTTLEGVHSANNTPAVVDANSTLEVFSGVLYALNTAARLVLTETEVENGWYVYEIETNLFYPITDKTKLGGPDAEDAFGSPVDLNAAFAARFTDQIASLNAAAEIQAKLSLSCRYVLDSAQTVTCDSVLNNPEGLNTDLGTSSSTIAAEDFGYFLAYNPDSNEFDILTLDGPTDSTNSLQAQAELFALSNLECVFCSPELSVDCPEYTGELGARSPFGSTTTSIPACRNQSSVTFDETGTAIPDNVAELYKALWQQSLSELSFTCFYGNLATEVKCDADVYEGNLCGLSERSINHREVVYEIPDAMVVEGTGNPDIDGLYPRDGDASGFPKYVAVESIKEIYMAATWKLVWDTGEVTSTDSTSPTPDLVDSWSDPNMTVRRATVSDFPDLICNLTEDFIPALTDPPSIQVHKELAEEIAQAFSSTSEADSCDLETLEATLADSLYDNECTPIEKPEGGWKVSSAHSVEGQVSENLFLTPINIHGGESEYINLPTPEAALAAIEAELEDRLENAVQTSDNNASAFAEAQTVCLFCNEPIGGLTCPAADTSIIIDEDPESASPTLRYLEARQGREICECEFTATSKLEAQRMAYAAALAARDCNPTGYGNDEAEFTCPGPETATSFGPGLNGEPSIFIAANSFSGATKFEAQQIAHNVGCALLECRFGNEEQTSACPSYIDDDPPEYDEYDDPPEYDEYDDPPETITYALSQTGLVEANTFFAPTQDTANLIAEAAAAAMRVCLTGTDIITVLNVENYGSTIESAQKCCWHIPTLGNPVCWDSKKSNDPDNLVVHWTNDTTTGEIEDLTLSQNLSGGTSRFILVTNRQPNLCGALLTKAWFVKDNAPLERLTISGSISN